MSAVTTRSASRGIATPTNMGDAMKLAEMLANSTMVPAAYKGKPGDVLVAVQMGAELGLSPLQALQNIASINGRPSVWGDAALALAQAHPLYVSHREWIEGEGDEMAGCCEVTRKGSAPHIARFSVRQAKKANLWSKPGPWQQYPERMLVLRARGFALRDKFADALRGLITAEEAQDMPPVEVQAEVVQPEAPAIAAPRHALSNSNTMQSQGFDAVDDALAMLGTLDDVRGYLSAPKYQRFYAKVQKADEEQPEAGFAARLSEIVQRHIERVSPADETETQEIEQ